MPYLLDTNIVIALHKNNASVITQIRRVGHSELRLCTPVEAELWFGVYNSGNPEANRQRLLRLLSWLPSLPFSSEAALLCGEIRAT
ncbi:MAG: type II toxin-antitoxin system VapC family toxin, partial [Candidatus Competibacteraceae bacterium]|nr:type II toxin-antitoxin system VapC family toxin [Candidatus Competibacteraceae bacterium]